MMEKMLDIFEDDDDVVEPYLCLTNGHDGFSSLKVCMTPVRVVCQNTLNMALRGAKRTWTVRHSGNINAKMEEAQQTLGLARDRRIRTVYGRQGRSWRKMKRGKDVQGRDMPD